MKNLLELKAQVETTLEMLYESVEVGRPSADAMKSIAEMEGTLEKVEKALVKVEIHHMTQPQQQDLFG